MWVFFPVVLSMKSLVVSSQQRHCDAWSRQWLQDFSVWGVNSSASRSSKEEVPAEESLAVAECSWVNLP